MSPVDPASVRALAELARLELSAEELTRLQGDLQRILAAFEALARHEGGAPLPAPSGAGHMRADRPVPSLEPEELLAAAPAHEDGFYLVPKTVGGPP